MLNATDKSLKEYQASTLTKLKTRMSGLTIGLLLSFQLPGFLLEYGIKALLLQCHLFPQVRYISIKAREARYNYFNEIPQMQFWFI